MRRPVLSPARALAATLSSLFAVGCATPSGSRPAEQVSVTPTVTRVESAGAAAVETRTVAENRSMLETIKVAPDVAWARMPAVFTELALPISGYVDPSKQILARNVRLRGRLGKTRMSQFVTCGSDVSGDDKANTYEVMLNVSTAIAPAPDGQAVVQSMVTASARPMAVSGEPVRCVTTGALEKRIATTIVLKAAAP